MVHAQQTARHEPLRSVSTQNAKNAPSRGQPTPTTPAATQQLAKTAPAALGSSKHPAKNTHIGHENPKVMAKTTAIQEKPAPQGNSASKPPAAAKTPKRNADKRSRQLVENSDSETSMTPRDKRARLQSLPPQKLPVIPKTPVAPQITTAVLPSISVPRRETEIPTSSGLGDDAAKPASTGSWDTRANDKPAGPLAITTQAVSTPVATGIWDGVGPLAFHSAHDRRVKEVMPAVIESNTSAKAGTNHQCPRDDLPIIVEAGPLQAASQPQRMPAVAQTPIPVVKATKKSSRRVSHAPGYIYSFPDPAIGDASQDPEDTQHVADDEQMDPPGTSTPSAPDTKRTKLTVLTALPKAFNRAGRFIHIAKDTTLSEFMDTLRTKYQLNQHHRIIMLTANLGESAVRIDPNDCDRSWDWNACVDLCTSEERLVHFQVTVV